MDEIFEKMQAMLGAAFQQGMAHQRMLDNHKDFEEEGEPFRSCS